MRTWMRLQQAQQGLLCGLQLAPGDLGIGQAVAGGLQAGLMRQRLLVGLARVGLSAKATQRITCQNMKPGGSGCAVCRGLEGLGCGLITSIGGLDPTQPQPCDERFRPILNHSFEQAQGFADPAVIDINFGEHEPCRDVTRAYFQHLAQGGLGRLDLVVFQRQRGEHELAAGEIGVHVQRPIHLTACTGVVILFELDAADLQRGRGQPGVDLQRSLAGFHRLVVAFTAGVDHAQQQLPERKSRLLCQPAAQDGLGPIQRTGSDMCRDFAHEHHRCVVVGHGQIRLGWHGAPQLVRVHLVNRGARITNNGKILTDP